MAGASAGAGKKSTEWHFGHHHDEILDSTLRARDREKRRLEAQLGAKDKSLKEKMDEAKRAKIPVTDLVRKLRDHISSHYDDVFDAFAEVDVNGNGRLRCVFVSVCARERCLATEREGGALRVADVCASQRCRLLRAPRRRIAIRVEDLRCALISADAGFCLGSCGTLQQGRVSRGHQGNGQRRTWAVE
jgi:hypothetical protein